ncbi:MAG: radical SAM protein [Candidatus Aminicenantales bacterium]
MAVEKPSRYAGGEWNAIRKDPASVRSRIVLAFPDLYEIGMSYLGQKILYERANARPDVLAERVFAPWPDFERALRAAGEPLRSLENGIPLAGFDIVAFSLLYELNDSNVLTILDLGGIPVSAAGRSAEHPRVLAGGPAVFNPEPLGGVFDAFFLGDGEEGLLEICDAWAASKGGSRRRAERVAALAEIPGVYVPSLYETFRTSGSPLLAVRPGGGSRAPAVVHKRVLASFARSAFPEKIVVPNLQAVFDRVAVEVARGCPQKCRFCQATSLYAPYRVKDPGCVIDAVRNSVEATGYEDASLFGLSVGDYPYLEPVVERLMASLAPRRVSLSLSSLRPKRLSAEIAETITKVRKTGFTLVPEAGTERLRRVINKPVEDGDLWEAADHAFRSGWRLLKLYWKKLLFIALMLVLPGGLIVLFLCATAWALNWEHEMTAYMDATYKKWKEEHDIHSE